MATRIGDRFGVAVTTVEETIAGWQHAYRQARDAAGRAAASRRLVAALAELANWPVFPLTVAAINRHADFVRQRINVGGNDLRIAALALEHGATVLTRNLRDFRRVPGLAAEDWSS